jgi:hypothetical protein
MALVFPGDSPRLHPLLARAPPAVYISVIPWLLAPRLPSSPCHRCSIGRTNDRRLLYPIPSPLLNRPTQTIAGSCIPWQHFTAPSHVNTLVARVTTVKGGACSVPPRRVVLWSGIENKLTVIVSYVSYDD